MSTPDILRCTRLFIAHHHLLLSQIQFPMFHICLVTSHMLEPNNNLGVNPLALDCKLSDQFNILFTYSSCILDHGVALATLDDWAALAGRDGAQL
ncbi:hypothetical protein ACJX0J_039859, partial [Zea mays]